MKSKQFFGKFASPFLWGNLLAMVLVVVGLAFGVNYGLEQYTRHDESIKVPKVEGMDIAKARKLLAEHGLDVMVSDSGHNKRFAANCVLAQNPGAGLTVKSGHVIYVTVNSPSSLSYAIPDLIDNSSLREAEAKLTAMGFKLTPPQEISGEKDWVYGILCRGRNIMAGERVSIDFPLTLVIGSGVYGSDDEKEMEYVEPEYRLMESGNVDEFEEMTEGEEGTHE